MHIVNPVPSAACKMDDVSHLVPGFSLPSIVYPCLLRLFKTPLEVSTIKLEGDATRVLLYVHTCLVQLASRTTGVATYEPQIVKEYRVHMEMLPLRLLTLCQILEHIRA